VAHDEHFLSERTLCFCLRLGFVMKKAAHFSLNTFTYQHFCFAFASP
jgi:hypothetical protein